MSQVTISGNASGTGIFTILSPNSNNNQTLTLPDTTGTLLAPAGGTLTVAQGGTGQTTYTDGQLLIGNSTGNTLTKATLTGTANRVTVTNGAGSITLSGPQDIATSSSPSFAGMTISGTTATYTGGSAATYGAFSVRGEKNAWSGINFRDSSNVQCNTLMARSSDGYGGVYNKADNAWLVQWDGSGNFTAAANVTAYSDERLKKDWADLPVDFVERLAKVKHGTYTRIDSEQRQAGASAQDMQKLLAEVVNVDEQGVLTLAYGNAALVAVIKLAQKVIDQEARLADLESRMAALEGKA